MSGIGSRKRKLITVMGLILLATAAAAFYFVRHSSQPHYRDSFASGKTAEWRAYGGSWDFYKDAIRNNSDERGAKLVTGSSNWRDYKVQADLLLLGQNGDAGIIVRSSDEEEGVDAYSGYYVGLRDRNNTMVIGRADHGWMEYQAVPMTKAVRPFHWYHLTIVAVGCEIAALSLDPEDQQQTVVAMREPHCAERGRIGLRSYSSGGLWKNVRVESARRAELAAIAQRTQAADSPERMQTETGFNSLLPYSGKVVGPTDTSSANRAMDIHTPSLSSLRFESDFHPVTVRGSVVLTTPVLYIEDATGGIAVEPRKPSSVKIGDELQVTGTVDARPVGVRLRDAGLRLLWSREPAPPLSVTAAQAVTGAFDGMLIEIEGRLIAKNQVQGQSLALELRSEHLDYRAILEGARQDLLFERLQPNTILRLKGVCVAEPAYTENLTSFAVLLRSSEDVGIVSGPPWWDIRHVLESVGLLTALIIGAVFIYFRAEHWRMSAVIEERLRMAREIHDTLAQGFAGIALQLESALHEVRSEVDSAPVTMALQMARQSRREAHRSITALRTLHTDQSLETMLSKVLRPQVAERQIQLLISTRGTPDRLSSEAEGQILRIAQEAVANSVQHAFASKIEVRLAFDTRELRIEIDDDGRGFDVAAVPASEDGHFGITGMRERAASIKADLRILSSGNGTRISLVVPAPRQGGHFRNLAPRWMSRIAELPSWKLTR